jgi:hypothetical protein
VKSGAVAKRVSNITKQALGEFVTDLQTAGLVDVKPDPSEPGTPGHPHTERPSNRSRRHGLLADLVAVDQLVRGPGPADRVANGTGGSSRSAMSYVPVDGHTYNCRC